MIINSIKQVVLLLAIFGLALAIIYLVFSGTFGNSIFDIPSAFLKKFGG